MENLKTRRFLWGMLLAWSTLTPVMNSCVNAFKGISEQKATGMAALVGGLAEGLVPYGLVLTIIAQVTAIILLMRGFSRGDTGRSVLSAVSICWSALTLFLIASTVWLYLKMHANREKLKGALNLSIQDASAALPQNCQTTIRMLLEVTCRG
jgi:ACR3 family arsenite efflux pump ArsB